MGFDPDNVGLEWVDKRGLQLLGHFFAFLFALFAGIAQIVQNARGGVVTGDGVFEKDRNGLGVRELLGLESDKLLDLMLERAEILH